MRQAMNSTWKMKFTLLPGIMVLGAGLLCAEEVTTTEGTVYPNTTLRRSGSTIMIRVTMPDTSGTVEMGLPIARIAKVAFPEPPELAKAITAASKGNAKEVLALTGDYVAKQGEFKDLPGSWWPEMAKIRLLALAASGQDTEAANLARELGSLNAPGTESLSRSGTLLAPLASGESEAVILGVKGLPKTGGDQGAALGQLALGRALLLKKDYPGAMRAFLTVKVFHPSLGLLQPAALMGASEAYLGLKDEKRAAQTFEEITTVWPDSPQAPEAKKRAEALTSAR